MNREIKFRAKRIFDNQWVYGNLVNGYVLPFDYFEEDGHHLRCDSDTPIFTDEKTIGQFTGLKDANGVDIYEGDILAYKTRDYKYHVVFENGSFTCYHLTLKDFDSKPSRWGLLSRAFDVDMKRDLGGVEVIGNIHENPELLNS